MKQSPFYLLSLLTAVFLFSGCLRDECTSEQTYIRYDPVYKPLSEIRVSLKAESPRALKEPGSLYAWGNYLFINEKQQGIHVIDNSDPSDPKPIAFWSIPGNVSMAIRGTNLYADQYIDLLTIDISQIDNPKLVCRVENVFQLFGFDPQNGFIVDYKQTEVTEKLKCNDFRVAQTWFAEGDQIFVLGGPRKDTPLNSGNGTSLPSTVGVAGSYARFGIVGDYLYTVENWQMRSWSLADPVCPARSDSTWLGWNAETIFTWKDRLFIGSQTGVFIFDNRNPAHPVLEAQFNHATGCDPVVCDEEHAFVTVHDGTTCNGTFNQLDIIDIAQLPTANLIKSYPMTHPAGLSITNNHLFLCDNGLKVFDRSDVLNLKELAHVSNIDAYDVISLSADHLLLIGADGFYQFDVSNPAAPAQISSIPVEK